MSNDAFDAKSLVYIDDDCPDLTVQICFDQSDIEKLQQLLKDDGEEAKLTFDIFDIIQNEIDCSLLGSFVDPNDKGVFARLKQKFEAAIELIDSIKYSQQ